MQWLGELNWAEGRSIKVEYRSAEGVLERAGEIAVEFVRLNVDVIVTAGDAQVLAAKWATEVIPIVIAAAGDPIGNGLVASLARPGGNVTRAAPSPSPPPRPGEADIISIGSPTAQTPSSPRTGNH